MSLPPLDERVANASPPEPAAPGLNVVVGSTTCPHPEDAWELASTNGLTYYYQCAQCNGVVVVWRR